MKNKHQYFSLTQRLKSFKYALNGIKILLMEEHNARVHLVIAILVIAAGVYFSISSIEWMILILTIGVVIAMEAINSALENLADAVSLKQNKFIQKAKDLSASAVLITAMSAIIIGGMVFIPKILLELK